MKIKHLNTLTNQRILKNNKNTHIHPQTTSINLSIKTNKTKKSEKYKTIC